MQTVINLFSAHGTFVQPDALQYIMSKEDPHTYCESLMASLTEYPLVLTIDFLKNKEPEPIDQQKQVVSSMDEKKLQTKMLSKLLSNQLVKEVDDENEDDSDDDLNGSSNEDFSGITRLPEISSPKSWHPFSKDFSAHSFHWGRHSCNFRLEFFY